MHGHINFEANLNSIIKPHKNPDTAEDVIKRIDDLTALVKRAGTSLVQACIAYYSIADYHEALSAWYQDDYQFEIIPHDINVTAPERAETMYIQTSPKSLSNDVPRFIKYYVRNPQNEGCEGTISYAALGIPKHAEISKALLIARPTYIRLINLTSEKNHTYSLAYLFTEALMNTFKKEVALKFIQSKVDQLSEDGKVALMNHVVATERKYLNPGEHLTIHLNIVEHLDSLKATNLTNRAKIQDNLSRLRAIDDQDAVESLMQMHEKPISSLSLVADFSLFTAVAPITCSSHSTKKQKTRHRSSTL